MDGQIETQTRRENKHDELHFGADNELRTGVESDLLGVVEGDKIGGGEMNRFFSQVRKFRRGEAKWERKRESEEGKQWR